MITGNKKYVGVSSDQKRTNIAWAYTMANDKQALPKYNPGPMKSKQCVVIMTNGKKALRAGHVGVLMSKILAEVSSYWQFRLSTAPPCE